MNPNDVHELLNSIIQEHSLPITTYSGNTLLIVEGEEPVSKQCMETILKQWQGEDVFNDYKYNHSINGNWRVSYRTTLTEIHNKIESIAADSSCVSEAREVLQALIEERSLPIKTIKNRMNVIILPDSPIDYRTEEMIELDDLLQKMELEGSLEEDIKNVHVRHSGFSFGPKKGTPDIDFSQVQELTNYLQSEIVEHGLHVKLIHKDFALETDNEIDLDRTETEEIVYRLTIMTGINFRIRGYGGNTTYLGPDRADPY